MLSTQLDIRISESLPTLKGQLTESIGKAGYSGSGCFSMLSKQSDYNINGGIYQVYATVDFNASSFSSVYKEKGRVTPQSTQCSFLIKY